MFRLILSLYPPGLCLFVTLLMGLFINPLFYVLSVVFLGDLVARYKDYRFLSRVDYISIKIIKRYSKSWCQRTLMGVACPKSKRIYYAAGYRWYHLLPDGFISRKSPLFRLKWYKMLFYGTEEVRKPMKARDDYEMRNLTCRAKKLAKILGAEIEGTANYGCVFHKDDKGGRDMHIYGNTACHAGLLVGENGYRQARHPDMIVSAIWNAPDGDGPVRPKWFERLGVRYYTYLVKQSIYAPIFVKQSMAEIMNIRAFIITPHVPDVLLFGGLCATRAMWEHTEHIIIWDILVKGGINPGIALAMCKSMKLIHYDYRTASVSKAGYEKSAEELDITKINVILGGTGHWALPAAMFDVRKLKRYGGTFADVKNLYKHCLTYHETSTYGDCNEMYSTINGANCMRDTLSVLLNKMNERKIAGKEVIELKSQNTYRGDFTGATLTVKGAVILAKDLTKIANKY